MHRLHYLASKSPSIAITSRLLTTESRKSKLPFWEHQTIQKYDALVHSAGRSRDFDAIYNLLNSRVKQKCFNSASTFRFITNAESDITSLLRDLNWTLARLDKGFTRKSAYDSLISRLCKLGRVPEAIWLVKEMVAGEHGADSVTYYPILRELLKKKRMEEAWDVIDQMRKNGILPHLMIYNEFLTVYCLAGDLNSAVDVLRKIDEAGFKADARTYDAMVLGACRSGNVEKGLRVLRRMVEDGVSPMYCTYGHITTAMVKLGCYKQAVDFVIGCGGTDTFLDTESFGILAARLIRVKRFEEANVVLMEMSKRGLSMGQKLKEYYIMNVPLDL